MAEIYSNPIPTRTSTPAFICPYPYSCLHIWHIIITGKVDLQERGLREEDWECPIDSRDQEYTQKFAADNSNHAQTLANFAELGKQQALSTFFQRPFNTYY